MAKKKKYIVLSDEDFLSFDEPREERTVQRIKWRLRIEKKGRGGKVVTIVDDNLEATELQLNELSKELKQFCGVGGSVKEEGIVLQGDVRKKVLSFLKNAGCKDVK